MHHSDWDLIWDLELRYKLGGLADRLYFFTNTTLILERRVLKMEERIGGARESAASAHAISRASTNMDSIEVSMCSNITQKPFNASPTVVSQCSSVDQQVMDQFAQMKTMLSPFLKPNWQTTRIAFCNFWYVRLRIYKGQP